jgi:O-antigen ligase
MQFLFTLMIGGPLIGVVLVLQGTLFELPLPAQRALSFLPADWDRRAVQAAEGSSEWRFLMWHEALTSDRYIRNKWIGDGFGFTAQELAYQQQLMVRGVQSADQQDYYLAVGSYHSGPIETIKRVGYFGLAVLLIVMGVFFKVSVNLVNRTRGTPYFPYAMFVSLPIVILPVMFVFIFGAFQPALTQLLLAGGMLRLIGNSFEGWEKNERAAKKTEASVLGESSLALAGRSRS